MQANNLEPRRFWRQQKKRYWSLPPSDMEEPIEECGACGDDRMLAEWRGAWFCTECLDDAIQSYLDPTPDDLSEPH